MTVRLNLGAGDARRDGFVSVDLREDIADVVCDVRKLEGYADGEVDEILALDLLEHLPASETADVLAEWRRVLRPGGLLTVKCPNMYQLARAIVAYTDLGRLDTVNDLIRNVMGGHKFGPEGAWDTHHWNFVPATLQAVLEAAGFEVLSNDGGLNMKVVARRV
jgi:ubiquinone/menaquinone biosynthesis C-methylase UbiE